MVNVRNVVLRRAALDAVLTKLGLHLAQRAKVGMLRLSVTFRLRSDLGLFSEPWQVLAFHYAARLLTTTSRLFRLPSAARGTNTRVVMERHNAGGTM